MGVWRQVKELHGSVETGKHISVELHGSVETGKGTAWECGDR